MPSSLWKHLPKIVVRHKVAFLVLLVGAVLTFHFHGPIGSLLASATSSLTDSPGVLFFTPYSTEKTLRMGTVTDIDVNINAKVPINAIGATIQFPTDSIEIVGISKKKSFLDLWTEDTSIHEDVGEVRFSGGTTQIGGMTGTGTVLTLSVKAKKEGDAKLYFKDLQVYAHDGKGTSLPFDYRSYTVSAENPTVAEVLTSPAGGGAPTAPQRPSPDLDGNGKINLIDVSIMTVHLIGPYNPRYDLDMDGSVGFSDLSIIFAKMGN